MCSLFKVFHGLSTQHDLLGIKSRSDNVLDPGGRVVNTRLFSYKLDSRKVLFLFRVKAPPTVPRPKLCAPTLLTESYTAQIPCGYFYIFIFISIFFFYIWIFPMRKPFHIDRLERSSPIFNPALTWLLVLFSPLLLDL